MEHDIQTVIHGNCMGTMAFLNASPVSVLVCLDIQMGVFFKQLGFLLCSPQINGNFGYQDPCFLET